MGERKRESVCACVCVGVCACVCVCVYVCLCECCRKHVELCHNFSCVIFTFDTQF